MRRSAAWGSFVLMLLAGAIAFTRGRIQAFPLNVGTAYSLYLPAVMDNRLIYLPQVMRIDTLPLPLNNPSFENVQWLTDQQGNQHPTGWTYYSPAAGQVMPFPTKMQQGNVVTALSAGPGEYVHKYWWQLPEDERLGGSRGLILDGGLVYKAFGGGGPHALRLSQVVTGTAGATVRVTGYILGETHDNLPLEADHFVVALRVSGAEDKRLYANMVQHHDVPGNQRAWNRFAVTTTVPSNGFITVEVIVQQNWSGRTDFFLDDFSAERIFELP